MAVIKIRYASDKVATTTVPAGNATTAANTIVAGELAFGGTSPTTGGVLVIGTGTNLANAIIGGSTFFDQTVANYIGGAFGKTGTGSNVLATGPTLSGTVSITGATTSLTVGADATPVATTLYGTLTVGSNTYQRATTLNGTLIVAGNTTLSGGTVTIADGTTIKGTGTTAATAVLTIQPGSTAASGTLVVSGNLSITGATSKITVRGIELNNTTINSTIGVGVLDLSAGGFANKNAVTAPAFMVVDSDLQNNDLTALAAGYVQTGTVMANFLTAPDGGRISGIDAYTIDVFKHPTDGDLNGEISANRLKIVAADGATQVALIDIAGDIVTLGSVTAANFIATGGSTFSYANGISFKDSDNNPAPAYIIRPSTDGIGAGDVDAATNLTSIYIPRLSTGSITLGGLSGTASSGTTIGYTPTSSTVWAAGAAISGTGIPVGATTATASSVAGATASLTLAGGVTLTSQWLNASTNITVQPFDVFAVLNSAQTFTNKTLTSPNIGTINAAVAINGATSGGTLTITASSTGIAGTLALVGETILSGAIAGNISADNISSTASVTAGTIFNSASPNDFNKIFTASTTTASGSYQITFASAPTVPTGATLVGSFINGAGIAAGTTITIAGATLTLNAPHTGITATNYIISFARTITSTAASLAWPSGSSTATLTIQALSYIVYAGSVITNANFPQYSYVSANAAVGATSLAVTFGSALSSGITTLNATFTIIHARHFLSAAIAGSSGSSIISTTSGLVGGSIIYRNSYIFGTGITALTTIIKTTESATAATALRLSNPLTAPITASPYVIINMVPAATISSTGAFTTSGAISVESGNSLFGGAITSTGAISGNSLTASTGVTVTSGGLTVTSGGVTVTAGGLTVTAGGLNVTAGAATFNYASGISFKDVDDTPISAYVIRPNEATDADTHVSTILLPRCTNTVIVTVTTTAAGGNGNTLTIANNTAIFPVGSVITGSGVTTTGTVVTTTAGVGGGGYTTVGLSASINYAASTQYTITYAIDTLAVLGSAQTFTGGPTFSIACPRSTITPVDDNHIANKLYVDNVAIGLHIHPPVDVISAIANFSTITSGNNTSAVASTGTLTININDANIEFLGTGLVLTIDGISATGATGGSGNLPVGSRIAIFGETDATKQCTAGIYTITTFTATTLKLERALDANVAADLSGGDFIFVKFGTTYADTGFVQTESPGRTTAGGSGTVNGNSFQTPSTTTGSSGPYRVNFAQFSQAGIILAGEGLTKSGNTIAIGTIEGGTF